MVGVAVSVEDGVAVGSSVVVAEGAGCVAVAVGDASVAVGCGVTVSVALGMTVGSGVCDGSAPVADGL